MFRVAIALALSLALAAPAMAAKPAPVPVITSRPTPGLLTPAERAAIDKAALQVLARTGVPSASIAIVKDGKLAYIAAYGRQRLEVAHAPSWDARYAIGSVSKQFTATAVLMLVEEGKVSLDDPVGKYVPGLTAGDRITVRQILSHTSGYRDYWPQDYVMDEMLHPTTPGHILDKWARIPLDFEPGAQYQYSNTGYTVAGQIIEKVTGRPYLEFIQARIFKPLGMTSATEVDTKPLGPTDARGYMRFALGPLHPAPKEGAGWLYAMGALAMTPRDLAAWDVSLMNRSLLKPASYDAMFAEVMLNDGKGAGYGLGVTVGKDHGKRMISHGGEVSGFLAENRVYVDDKIAIVVLTNADFGGAQTSIADRIGDILFPGDDQTQRAKAVFDQLRRGHIDRAQFTPNANAYFSPAALKDFAASLGPLGEPTSFTQTRKGLRGGMTVEVYRVVYPNRALRVVVRAYPDGRIEQFLVQPSD